MLDPSEARLWAETVGHMVAEAEATLIRALRDTIEEDLGAHAYRVKRLGELATIRARLERDLGRDWETILEAAQRILDDARYAGQGQAIRDLKNAGLPTVLPDSVAAAVELIALDTMKSLTRVKTIALRDAVDAYQKIISTSVSDVVLGASTRVEATQKALLKFASRGITGFVDKSGRNWRMDSYAEMAVRTGATHALNRGWMTTLLRNGEDLIRVSDHGHECPLCATWEHKVLSISGSTPPGTHVLDHATSNETVTVNVYASVQDAIEAGLWHPNCGHTATLFLPGVTPTPPPEHDPETYKAGQAQRAHEREIRRYKRMREAAITPEVEKALDKRIRQHQAAIRGIIREYPVLKRKRLREQIEFAH